MWKCPECKHEIKELQYQVSTQSSEYGTASLSEKFEITNYKIIYDHNNDDQGDTEWDGSPEYTCPECENEVDPTELIWVIEDEEENKPEIPPEPEETLFKIICPKIQIIRKECPKDSSCSTLICKNCKHIFVCDTANDYDNGGTFECPKCYETNTVKEYKELLLKGFFEPNYDRKKT